MNKKWLVAISSVLAVFWTSVQIYEHRNSAKDFLVFAVSPFVAAYYWVFSGHLVSGWLVLVGAAALLFCCFKVLRHLLNRQKADKFSLTNYTQVVIDGIRWKWEYSNDGTLRRRSFAAYCGDCHKALVERDKYEPITRWNQRRHSIGRFLYCTKCEKVHTQAVQDTSEFYRDTASEIQRRIDTGEYKSDIGRSLNKGQESPVLERAQAKDT